jgi:hypothetical protein
MFIAVTALVFLAGCGSPTGDGNGTIKPDRLRSNRRGRSERAAAGRETLRGIGAGGPEQCRVLFHFRWWSRRASPGRRGRRRGTSHTSTVACHACNPVEQANGPSCHRLISRTIPSLRSSRRVLGNTLVGRCCLARSQRLPAAAGRNHSRPPTTSMQRSLETHAASSQSRILRASREFACSPSSSPHATVTEPHLRLL